MSDAVEELGDERLVLDAAALGAGFQRIKITLIDSDIEHRVFLAAGDGPGDLVKLRLTPRDPLTIGETSLQFPLTLCQLHSSQFHISLPRLCNLVYFLLG